MSGAEQSGGQDTVGKVGIRLSVGGPGRWELEKGAVVDTRQDGTSQQASRQPSSKEREHDALTVAVQSRLWHAKGEGVREGDGRWAVGGGRRVLRRRTTTTRTTRWKTELLGRVARGVEK